MTLSRLSAVICSWLSVSCLAFQVRMPAGSIDLLTRNSTAALATANASSNAATALATNASAPTKPRPLAFKHLSKMAGTFMIEALNRVMGEGNWILIDELFGLTQKRRGNAFVISSARNPCDYYVSLWAFDSDKNFAKFSMRDGGSAFFEEGNLNPQKFANWLNWTQSHGHGIMSYRLWETLINQRDDMTCWDQVLGFCGEQFNDTRVGQELAAWSPRQTADCWVHTESLFDDMRGCLEQYHKETGVEIDWNAFDALIHPKEPSPRGNPSDHKSCQYYFNNSDAADSVMKSDRHLFEAFGYKTCCGHATIADMK